jgi:hypothetical protein
MTLKFFIIILNTFYYLYFIYYYENKFIFIKVLKNIIKFKIKKKFYIKYFFISNK